MSDNFTKMCDCPEIQGLRLRTGSRAWYLPTQEGMCFIALGTNDTFMLAYSDIEDQGHLWAGRDDFIVEPAIEQLMGMVAEGFSAREQLNRFASFLRNYRIQGDDSVKELWLAFVMHELHNKRWSGERWE